MAGLKPLDSLSRGQACVGCGIWRASCTHYLLPLGQIASYQVFLQGRQTFPIPSVHTFQLWRRGPGLIITGSPVVCCSVAKLPLTLCEPYELQHTRLPCLSPTPKACLNSNLSDPLLSPSPPALSLSQHQGLFQ